MNGDNICVMCVLELVIYSRLRVKKDNAASSSN